MMVNQEQSRKQIGLLLISLYVFMFFCYMVFFYEHQDYTAPILSSLGNHITYDFSNDEDLAQQRAVTLSPEVQDELQLALAKAQEHEYNIVVWEPPFGARSNPSHTDGSQCGKCMITQDKSKVDDPDTKAVIFHFNEASRNNVPKNRRPDQLYTWWTMESSPALLQLRHMTLKQFDNFFNLTASHRRDSDVYWPYNTFEGLWNALRSGGSGDPQKDVDALISGKTNLALWIVSNCGSTGGSVRRMDVAHKLVDAGLNLDRRGRCFPRNGAVTDRNIIKKYKFYLSFENGFHCADYITEKLFHNGYMMGAVPVVWGAKKSDYLAAIPPHSFIYVDDFPTPASLVKYLNYLDKNDTAYREYFAWRTKNVTEMPQYGRKTGSCQLCRIIHGINVDNVFSPNYKQLQADIPMFGYPNKSRIVPSLGEWYYATESPECFQQHSNLQTFLSSFGL